MKFEEILAELGSISAKLEAGDLSIEEGIELYNKGLELSKKAIEILKEGKGKITLLSDELGKLADSAFEVEEQ